METKSVKVQVYAEFYEKIKDIQQNLRKQEGKKTSLAEIILGLAEKGVKNIKNEQNKIQNTQNENNFAQKNNDFTQNTNQNAQNHITKNMFLTSENSKSEYLLRTRAEYLNKREEEIRELEADLFAERENQIEKERDLLNFERELMKRKFKAKYNNIENEIFKKIDNYGISEKTSKEDIPNNYENDLAKIYKTLSDIKKYVKSKDNERNHSEVIRYLEQLLQNDNRITTTIRKSQEKTLLQQFEPFIPAIATVLASLYMNKKYQNANIEKISNEIKALISDDNKNEREEG